MTSPAGQLAIKDIAALAGVSRAAVGNWRTRHDDFPAPIEGTPARRPLFNLAEIMAWLKSNDLLSADALEERTKIELWAILNSLREAGEPIQQVQLVLYLVALRKYAGNNPDAEAAWVNAVKATTIDELADIIRNAPVANEISENTRQHCSKLLTRLDLDSVFAPLVAGINTLTITNFGTISQLVIDRLLGLGGRGKDSVFGSSNSASSALLARAAATTVTPGTTIYDPACGIGGTLLNLYSQVKGLSVIGHDIDINAVAIAELNAYLSDVPAIFLQHDSLENFGQDDVQASTIVVEPPLGYRLDLEVRQDILNRVGIEGPGFSNTDEAFILSAISNLAPGGVGYIVTTPAAGFSKMSTNMRQNLVAKGLVEAVIHLPARFLMHTGIESLLWVVRSPHTPSDDRVLIADARQVTSPEQQVDRWLNDMRAGRETSIPSGTVSLAELITHNGKLLPSQLLQQTPDGNEVTDNLLSSRKKLQEDVQSLKSLVASDLSLLQDVPMASSSMSLKQMIDSGLISVQRGSTVRPNISKATGSKVSVYVASGVNRPGEPKEVSVPEDSSWLEDNDILVPTPVNIPARVFQADGHRWMASVGTKVLRVESDMFDRDYVVACINASFNDDATVGSGMIRQRDFDSVLIPQLGIEQQRGFVASLAEVTHLKEQFEAVSQQVQHLMDAALNVVRFGAAIA